MFYMYMCVLVCVGILALEEYIFKGKLDVDGEREKLVYRYKGMESRWRDKGVQMEEIDRRIDQEQRRMWRGVASYREKYQLKV